MVHLIQRVHANRLHSVLLLLILLFHPLKKWAAVAAGRFDAFWETGLKPWDVAAGIVLVREAGGFVTEIGGGHTPLNAGSLLAANAHLHLPVGQALRAASRDKPDSRLTG